jgi:5-formyltetrahydrofolate cyclo-ligase
MKQDQNRKTKILLRDEMRRITEEFSKNKDDVLTASIKTAHLVTHDQRYLQADTILAFMSLPNEIQTGLIIEQALKDGKKVAVPRILNKTDLEFYYIDSDMPILDQMEKNIFSILEPLKTATKFNLRNEGKQLLILVPGLAFSTTGDRLGHGMGYYDRFLSKLLSAYLPNKIEIKGIAIKNMPFIAGLCYNFQIYPSVPKEDTDIPVDCVFTDQSILTA